MWIWAAHISQQWGYLGPTADGKGDSYQVTVKVKKGDQFSMVKGRISSTGRVYNLCCNDPSRVIQIRDPQEGKWEWIEI